MPSIQETLVKAVSIRGGEILKDKQILCNILEDLSPDLYSTIAFINKIYTSAVGEMLFKAHIAKKDQRKTYIKEADRILEEEEDRGEKSRKAFFSYFELLLKEDYTNQKVSARDKTSFDIKDGVAAVANVVNRRTTQVEGSAEKGLVASEQTSVNISSVISVKGEDGYVVQNNSDGSVTEGYKKNGVWNGAFKKTFKDGTYYKGTYVSGKVSGELTYVDREGLSKVGIWENNNWNGKCRKENDDDSVTEGFLKNNVWNGPFTKTYASDVTYKGTYVNGKVEGKLTRIDKNGNTFICEWHNGNWNGDGVYLSKEGVLTGKWVDGEVIGKGIYNYNDGNVYEGGIKEFLREGKGVIRFPSSDIELTASFKDNEVVGSATILFPGGDTYVGSWHNNIAGHGLFTSTQCMGFQKITYDGEWKDGMPSGSGGELTIVPDRGPTILYVGDFVYGKVDGYGVLYKCNKSGSREPLITRKWKNNEFVSKLKRMIKDGDGRLANAVEYLGNATVEGMIANAVEYIRNATVKVSKVIPPNGSSNCKYPSIERVKVIYEERRRVLDGENMRDVIFQMMDAVVDRKVDMCLGEDADPEDVPENLQELNWVLIPIIPVRPLTPESVHGMSRNKVKQALKEEAGKLYEAKEAEFPDIEKIRELERVVLLKVIDARWMNQIDDMEQLRQGIGLAAFGQQDPKVKYRMIGFDMFDEMTSNIQEETMRIMYHIRIEQTPEREECAKPMTINKEEEGPKKPVQRKKAIIYPNDPCPCGSGKKYKNCHGRPGSAPLS